MSPTDNDKPKTMTNEGRAKTAQRSLIRLADVPNKRRDGQSEVIVEPDFKNGDMSRGRLMNAFGWKGSSEHDGGRNSVSLMEASHDYLR